MKQSQMPMPQQTNFNVIVVGGGLGGLTAGATLSSLGRKVVGTSSFLTSMRALLDKEGIDRGQINIDDFG